MSKVRAADVQPRFLKEACQFFTFQSTNNDLCLKAYLTVSPASGCSLDPMALEPYEAIATLSSLITPQRNVSFTSEKGTLVISLSLQDS